MTTHQTLRQRGHTALFVVIAVIVVTGAIGAWQYVRSSQTDDAETAQQPTQQAAPTATTEKPPADPTEGGKYLVIAEWGVRVPLPETVHGKVSYSLGAVTADPDGNNIQGAKILLAASLVSGSVCATSTSSVGPAVESGAQYIRSEAAKPFDAARYRWTFKENILTDSTYAYHLNYLTPDCIGSAGAPLVEAFNSSLDQLQPIE